MKALVLGTRGSALALAQARSVQALLARGGQATRLQIVRTSGDRVTDRAFAAIGAPGVFVREIESALLAGEIDLAVHSYKDLPTQSPAGLLVAAVPDRADPADVLLVRAEAWDAGASASAVPAAQTLPLARGARVGTSAARRSALLLEQRPDLDIALLRGSVPTRVERLRSGEYAAIVLAAAGLERLARADALGAEAGARAASGAREAGPEFGTSESEPRAALELDGLRLLRLDPRVHVPAPSQGALAVQVRARDELALAAVRAIDAPELSRLVAAERALLALLDGGCGATCGAYAQPLADSREFELHGLAPSEAGLARASARGGEALELAQRVLRALLAQGARVGSSAARTEPA